MSDVLNMMSDKFGIRFSASEFAQKIPEAAIAIKAKRMLAKCHFRDEVHGAPKSIRYETEKQRLRLVLNAFISRPNTEENIREAHNSLVKLGIRPNWFTGNITKDERISLIEVGEIAFKFLKKTHKKFSVEDMGDPIEQIVLDIYKDIGANARKADLTARLALEVAYSVKNQKVIIFDTLTVDDRFYNLVFRDDPNGVFKNYVARFKRKCGCEGRYFAVVEKGSKTGRLHIHVLWFLEGTPRNFGWRDPFAYKGKEGQSGREIYELKKSLTAIRCEIGDVNYTESGIRYICTKRDIKRSRNGFIVYQDMWPYGFQTPMLARWSNDGWTERGFYWPIVFNKKKRVLEQAEGAPKAIVGYLTKYLTKEVVHPNFVGVTKRWRVRKSQSIGTWMISCRMQAMRPEVLAELTRVPRTAKNAKVRQMVKIAARRALVTQIFENMQPDVTDILDLRSAPGLLSRLREMTSRGYDPEKLVNGLLEHRNSGPSLVHTCKSADASEALVFTERIGEWIERQLDAHKCAGFGLSPRIKPYGNASGGSDSRGFGPWNGNREG